MIKSARLQNFRSYNDETFEFEPGVNIVVGPNAVGKTNLLEALIVLARGSSFRARDSELVAHGRPWARLDGLFDSQNRSLKLEVDSGLVQKSFEIGQKPFKRLKLDQTHPIVYFEPNHLVAITRGPQERRDMIDELLELTLPDFKRLDLAYRRALAQRNALLKKANPTAKPQLFAWDIRLGELGSQIAKARQQLIDKLNKDLSVVYSAIAGKKTKAQITYAAQFPIATYASGLVSKLEKTAGQDLERGFTAWGPHREDIIFSLAGHAISQAASRGEVRTLLLALKTLELKLVESARGQTPIFLLDDVFSELDGKRRQALVETLKNYQTILTTTDAETVLEYFAKGKHRLIPVQKS